MLVHKGGQINNVQLITGLRIAEMSQLQNAVSCVQRMEVIVKMKKERKSQGGVGCVFGVPDKVRQKLGSYNHRRWQEA